MISLTIDPDRLRRIVAGSDAALGAVASASQRTNDARNAVREAREDLARLRGHEDESRYPRAVAALETAEAALAEATAEHNRVAEASRPVTRLARRCAEYASRVSQF